MPTEAALQWAKDNNSEWIPEVSPQEAQVRFSYGPREEVYPPWGQNLTSHVVTAVAGRCCVFRWKSSVWRYHDRSGRAGEAS